MVADREEEVDEQDDEKGHGDPQDQDLDRHGVGKGWERIWMGWGGLASLLPMRILNRVGG